MVQRSQPSLLHANSDRPVEKRLSCARQIRKFSLNRALRALFLRSLQQATFVDRRLLPNLVCLRSSRTTAAFQPGCLPLVHYFRCRKRSTVASSVCDTRVHHLFPFFIEFSCPARLCCRADLALLQRVRNQSVARCFLACSADRD